MRKHTRTTIIHIMATTTVTCITASGITAIGMPGSGTRVTGTLAKSRSLGRRIDIPSSQDYLASLRDRHSEFPGQYVCSGDLEAGLQTTFHLLLSLPTTVPHGQSHSISHRTRTFPQEDLARRGSMSFDEYR